MLLADGTVSVVPKVEIVKLSGRPLPAPAPQKSRALVEEPRAEGKPEASTQEQAEELRTTADAVFGSALLDVLYGVLTGRLGIVAAVGFPIFLAQGNQVMVITTAIVAIIGAASVLFFGIRSSLRFIEAAN